MKKNVGNLDMIVRLILAVIIAALGWYYQSWWGLVALVPFATAFLHFCPVWAIFGISTMEKKKN